ncbi:MAG: methylmalonyl Co-A mutase-associated GTPase MeaB [Deltaproteobacteria bacterium]|nr:methylmalonyl Co-A mutase-associated GTPase MeaB [Deltaproteobacteria bacterium]
MSDSPTQDGGKLFERLVSGDVAALARAITAVENNWPMAREILSRARGKAGHASVIGITGPPGAGKSTLISAYIGALRRDKRRVAVVAVDPASPISGGAFLGDRFRMKAHTQDRGVFIRSVSTRGHLGGLCAGIVSIVDIIDAAGWDMILLETVGAGQSETEVADIADINIVVQAPGLGDDIQALKAGILEIADVLVVNKADMPLADQTFRQRQTMLMMRDGDPELTAIVKTVATKETGIDRLKTEIDSRIANQGVSDRKHRSHNTMKRFLAREAAQRVEHMILTMHHPKFDILFDAVLAGERDLDSAVQQMLDLLTDVNSSDRRLKTTPAMRDGDPDL